MIYTIYRRAGDINDKKTKKRMTKYKNIRHKEMLQWAFYLKWEKTNDQV